MMPTESSTTSPAERLRSFFHMSRSNSNTGLLVLVGERPWRRGQLLPVARRALATLPAAGGLLLAYLYANLYTRHLGQSGMAAGRTLREVSGFSPHLNGFWDRHVTDVSGQILPGWILPGVLLAGLLCWL